MSVRIQFDLSDEKWEKYSRYINKKVRHVIGETALDEWYNRKEGKDRKLIRERRLKESKELEPIITDILKMHGVI